MRTYFAISSTKPHIRLLRDRNVKNVLFSFHYFKYPEMFGEYSGGWYPENIIVDSGAFSVWTQQGVIDIDKYAQFCSDFLKVRPDTTKVYFVNLDVLPGVFRVHPTAEQREDSAAQGWKNMEHLESKGLKVIPVFHQHEDFKWLKMMMEHTDYIGISPANDASQKSKDAWLAQVYSMVKQSVKTHGFAVTSFNTLKKYPFYSADSSSWIAGGKYGQVPLFKNGKFSTVRYKDKELLSKMWHNLPDDLKSAETFDSYMVRMTIGIQSYLEAEEFLTDVWSRRGIKWND